MAAKPSNAAKKALKKIQEEVTCGICLEPYKHPKLLKCFHVFCEKCLQSLVGGERPCLTCPQCRQETVLPVGGVTGLQGAFYIHHLFDIQDAFQKVSSCDQPMCSKCKKHEAVGFCRTCGFVCQRCVETHQDWEDLSTHEIIDLDTLTGDVTTLKPPLKQTLFCTNHPAKEADLYCDECDELICRDCIVRIHRDHQYDLVPESFAKQEREIVTSVQPVEEQIALLTRAVESVDAQCAAVIEQKTAMVAEIQTTIKHAQQALDVRKTELVSLAEHLAKGKVKILKAQRDELELQIVQRRSCQDFVEESRHTCSQGEILRMKSPLLKQVEELKGSFKPQTLALAEKADLKYLHKLNVFTKICQQFGKVYCHPVCPEKCQASGEGIKVAIRGQAATLCVEALESDREACLRPVDTLRCELVSSDGSSCVRGNVRRRDGNRYDVTYQPQHIGKYQLHVLAEERPILNSPFTVTVLPNLTAAANIIGDLNVPWGIAIKGGGCVVVTEWDGNCVSVINCNGEKKSFGRYGSAQGQLDCPEGVALDAGGNILVVDWGNHRIQKFSSTSKLLKTVGSRGSGCLQFQFPIGIAVHPPTQKIYVADNGNHRVQILSSDLTYSDSFGKEGSNIGEFNEPYDISTDGKDNVYVADRYNHRIQVFTVDGVYLRQFGKKGEGEGELDQPVSVAVDSHNVVYVCELGNNRISIFSTDGRFLKTFGSKGNGRGQFDEPYGIALDKNGTVYVSDTGNNRIQIFT